MTKTIKGDLILKEDTTFKESIIVKGNIKGYFDLKVTGNIDCLNIDCWNIHCLNINCRNIDCLNIDCRNIILCDKIKVKKGCKVRAKALIKDRTNIKQKDFELEGKK